MFSSYLAIMFISFLCGVVVGLINKGITININHKDKETEKPTEYNPSSAGNLPPDMLEYAQKNQGYINF